MGKLSIKNVDMIVKAINGAVGSSGYPITGAVLKSIGVDRNLIREMERKEYVKSVFIVLEHKNNSSKSTSPGRQMVKGYYTTKVPPTALVSKKKEPIPIMY